MYPTAMDSDPFIVFLIFLLSFSPDTLFPIVSLRCSFENEEFCFSPKCSLVLQLVWSVIEIMPFRFIEINWAIQILNAGEKFHKS